MKISRISLADREGACWGRQAEGFLLPDWDCSWRLEPAIVSWCIFDPQGSLKGGKVSDKPTTSLRNDRVVAVSLWGCQVAETSCPGSLLWLSASLGHIPAPPVHPTKPRLGPCAQVDELHLAVGSYWSQPHPHLSVAGILSSRFAEIGRLASPPLLGWISASGLLTLAYP